MHMVTPWRSMRSIAATGSKPVVGVTTLVAPSARNGSRPLMPPMWKSGMPESQTSSAPARISPIQLSRARDEVAVREHGALRPAGRARRVTHERRVVLGQLCLLGARRGGGDAFLVGAGLDQRTAPESRRM